MTGPAVAVTLLACLAALGAVIAWTSSSGWGVHFTSRALAFGLFVALGDLLEVPLIRRSAFSLGLAPALGFALMRDVHIGEVAAVFALGTAAATLVRVFRRGDLRLPVAAGRFLVVLAAAWSYRAVIHAASGVSFGEAQLSAFGLAAVLFVVIVVDVAAQAVVALTGDPQSLDVMLRDQFRATAPLLLSSVSIAALLALAYPTMKNWTLPLFLAPLGATEYSFRQVATIRRNYLQTVQALSKVPEMAGYTVRGHSGRVAQLSVEIAKEMRIGEPKVMDIEYAALLHDIGRVSLPDPEDDSLPIAKLELALVGAEIIEQTGHFPGVARMVREQNEPYRRRGEDANRDLSSGAKIIKVASAYDDLTEPPGPGRSPWDALEKLHLGMAYEFDPAVIQALTRVVEKRGLV